MTSATGVASLATRPADAAGYDVARVRADFPILTREAHPGVPLVYLDNAATSQKPLPVLDAERRFYERSNANVHRGIHVLAEEATALFEGARDTVADFLGAAREEVVFTKSATESFNLVARSVGDWADPPWGHRLGPGDEVCVTEMEHHSNLVPWQQLCQRTGATLSYLRLVTTGPDAGRLDLSDLAVRVNERTRIVSLVHQSNILGTVNPVDVVARRAKQVGALVLVDGCQSVPHLGVRVDRPPFAHVDFLGFSGHKMLGPTGVGVLWGRYDLLAAMPPFLGGGEMIELVEMTGSTYAAPPHRFEAGTPNIAQAIGLGAAVDYLRGLGPSAVAAHEAAVTAYALEALQQVPGLVLVGPADTRDRGPAISFGLADLHPHDIGQVLDEHGVAVRVGQHCARPVCTRYGVPATTRASFGPYTTYDEVDALVEGLHTVRRFFGGGDR